MQIISAMALYNYKVPLIVKKTTSHFVLVNHGKTFQIFSRTYKKNSRTFQDRKKNPGLFQDVATLHTFIYDIPKAINRLMKVRLHWKKCKS